MSRGDIARGWFQELRDQICAEFEALEREEESGPLSELSAGRFDRKAWRRPANDEDAGGGEMSVLRGRVFE